MATDECRAYAAAKRLATEKMRNVVRWLPCGTLAAMLASMSPAAQAMNYSVPYVRHGLGNSLDTWGYGSTLGLLEMNSGNNNINIYSNSPVWGLQTFREVQDYSGCNFPYGPWPVPEPGYTPTTNDDAHGTLVAHILDNMYSYNNQTNIPYTQMNMATDHISTRSLGMAPRASYYGALFDGTGRNGAKEAFLLLNYSLYYLTVFSHVQAINCSWGVTVNQASKLNGMSDTSLLMDEYTGYYCKSNGTTGTYGNTLMVVAAGDSGGLLAVPADAYNVLTVGALDSGNPSSTNLDDPTRAPIPRVADYSSKLPLADGRCGVDVVAPGTDMAILENFKVGADSNNTLKTFTGALGSTSFATPLVTGLAGILYGAPYHPWDNTESIITLSPTTLKGTPFSTDNKLIKATIINSADKIAGCDSNGLAQSTWQPGLIAVEPDGVTNSIHPLNYAVGSGQANAQETYNTYYEQSNRFWDVNMLSANGQINYYTEGQGKFINTSPGLPKLQITATVVWDRHVDYNVNTDTNDTDTIGTLLNDTNLLSKIFLVLQQETGPDTWTDIYRSISTVDNVQQVYMSGLSSTNVYRLEVIADNLADQTLGEQYALAVSYMSIPEPLVIGLANPANAGSVAGGGAYGFGSNVALTAMASNGWLFTGWNDGTTNNPYSITVPGTNITYTANFAAAATITVGDDTNVGGSVTGSGTFLVGSTNWITATASNGWLFIGWQDGSTANPRSVVVTTDGAHYTAEFIPAIWVPQLTAIAITGADVSITWQGYGGTTSAVQAATGALTNQFLDISPLIGLPGATSVLTNYMDAGVATNTPARFYRIRLQP